MALVIKDRVRQTSTTAGTGTITLSGSVTGYQDFTVIGTGNTTYYTIADQSGSNWEVGLGTWTSPNQLSRDIVYESSNGNALVNFGSNIKDVFVTLPAEGFASPPAIGGTTPNTITSAGILTSVSNDYSFPGSTVGNTQLALSDAGYTGITASLYIDDNFQAPAFFSKDASNNFLPFYFFAGNGLIDPSGAGVTLKAATSGNWTLTFPTSAGSNNQVLKTDGSGNLSWTGNLVLDAGTATAGTAPLKFTSGTNLTTAEAGAIEYNGTTVFITGTAASGRGINLAPQMVRINTNRTKATNNTTLEPLFDAANDVLALATNTLYYFKGVYRIDTTASGTAGGATIGFTFSNAQQEIGYRYLSHVIGYSAGQTSGYSSVATATTVTATSASAASYVIEIEGWFKSNATTGGTITPAFAQSVVGSAAAPTAAANTWLMIQPMGSPTATLLAGNWS